jgi:hypothetical protein
MLARVFRCILSTEKNEESEFEAKVSGICEHSEYRVQMKEKKVQGHFQNKRKAR